MYTSKRNDKIQCYESYYKCNEGGLEDWDEKGGHVLRELAGRASGSSRLAGAQLPREVA